MCDETTPGFTVAHDVPLIRSRAYSYLEGALEAEVMTSNYGASLPHSGRVWLTHAPDLTVTPEVFLGALPSGGVVTRTYTNGANLVVLVRGETYVAKIDCHLTTVDMEFAATTFEGATALAERFTEVLEYDPPDDESVTVRVWGGGDVLYHDHKPPVEWETVSENYAEATRAALSQLMAHTAEMSRSGKIILWHGEPGTGKSWALRSLVSSWRSWCQANLILDPEAAFADPKYVAQLLKTQGSTKHRLLICEDADSLVSSREGREGRLERILNMADGLVGQGSNVMILITTNAGPDRLDPAISRPGRCFANIAFTRFSLEETRARLKGSGLRVKEAMTLAETYNVWSRDQQISDAKPERSVGHYL
jgi:hypothetical protein